MSINYQLNIGKMKKRRNIMIYPFLLMCLFLVFASSCEKDDVEIPSSFTDPRDSTVYQTVIIGNQVWMVENLKYLPDVVPSYRHNAITPYHYVYGYNSGIVAEAKATANYATYGVLYNWAAAKKACPAGWHLPSDAEWTELIDYLGGESVASDKLREEGTTNWYRPNTGATNDSGFTALPGGMANNISLMFGNIATWGGWWSATDDSGTTFAWILGMNSNVSNVIRPLVNKEVGLSVRCVWDK